jgi:hypothetical protein
MKADIKLMTSSIAAKAFRSCDHLYYLEYCEGLSSLKKERTNKNLS